MTPTEAHEELLAFAKEKGFEPSEGQSLNDFVKGVMNGADIWRAVAIRTLLAVTNNRGEIAFLRDGAVLLSPSTVLPQNAKVDLQVSESPSKHLTVVVVKDFSQCSVLSPEQVEALKKEAELQKTPLIALPSGGRA